MTSSSPSSPFQESQKHSGSPVGAAMGRVIRTGSVLGSLSVLNLGVQVFLGNLLPSDEVDTWVLFLSLTTTLSVIGLLGSANGWASWYSCRAAEDGNWRLHLRARFQRIGPLSLLLIIAASLWFDLGYGVGFALALAVGSFQFKEILSAGLLRGRGLFIQAAFLQRAWLVILGGALLLLWGLGHLTLIATLGSFSIALLVNALLALWVASLRVPSGPVGPPVEADARCGKFWLISLSLVLGRALDRLVLASEDLDVGAYGMVHSVCGLFELTATALGFVLLPWLNQNRRSSLVSMFSMAVLVGASIAGFYLMWGESMAHLVFAGRYDHAHGLIPVFACSGFLHIIAVPAMAVMGGRLSETHLKRLATISALTLPLSFGLAMFLIPRYGLLGAALAGCAIEGLRVMALYLSLLGGGARAAKLGARN